MPGRFRMKKPGRAVLDPDERELREMLTPLTDALTDPDEGRRQDNVGRLLVLCPPQVLTRLLDRLVELAAARNAAVRRQARASLTQAGPAAVPALKFALTNRRRRGLQRAAAETLTAIVPLLGPDRLVNLANDATIVGLLSGDKAFHEALGKLRAAIRTALDQAARPTVRWPGPPVPAARTPPADTTQRPSGE
jgi:hypothetical protein